MLVMGLVRLSEEVKVVTDLCTRDGRGVTTRGVDRKQDLWGLSRPELSRVPYIGDPGPNSAVRTGETSGTPDRTSGDG